jgi:hypothetical protein
MYITGPRVVEQRKVRKKRGIARAQRGFSGGRSGAGA